MVLIHVTGNGIIINTLIGYSNVNNYIIYECIYLCTNHQ